MISVLIVDDEPLARSRLNRLLKDIDGVEVGGEAHDGLQALEKIREQVFDLVILDIEMPRMNGLEAAREIVATTNQPPAIVYCTAYDQYAIEAFDANAVAYLLKPVARPELEKAIVSAQRLSHLQIKRLTEAQAAASIRISEKDSVARLPLADIHYFRSEAKSVVAGLQDSREVVVSYSLQQLEDRFTDHFLRLHRNTLINKSELVAIKQSADGVKCAVLKNTETQFPISRRCLSSVKSFLNS